MDEKVYKRLKENHQLRYGSWAVWNLDCPFDLSFIDLNYKRLHTRYIFIGLNASQKLDDKSRWINYHYCHPHCHETMFAPVLGKKPFGGAYMTDLIKNLYCSDSTCVKKHFQLDTALIRKSVNFLKDEFSELEKYERIGLCILMGNAAWELWNKYFASLGHKSAKISGIGRWTDKLKGTYAKQVTGELEEIKKRKK
jgi:hypothetical protein